MRLSSPDTLSSLLNLIEGQVASNISYSPSEKTTKIEGMTLLDYFPETFSGLENSALTSLMKNVEVFSFEQDRVRKGDDLSDRVGVGESIPTEKFLKLFVENKLNTMVQTANDDLAYELFIASIILMKPRLFLNNPLTILNAQDQTASAMRVWQENFNATEHKARVLESLQQFIGRNKSMNRLSDNILIIVDELFSNALFNAPVDENGYRIFKHEDRNANVQYPDQKTAKIFAVHTTDNLFLGAVDPWGSVDRDGICQSLYEAYTKGRITQDSKGAGLGLRMMLDRSRSLYLVSEKGARTLACCHMRLNISLKKIESVPKQLHIHCF